MADTLDAQVRTLGSGIPQADGFLRAAFICMEMAGTYARKQMLKESQWAMADCFKNIEAARDVLHEMVGKGE